MRKVHWYITQIKEELEGAKMYAEKYLLNKGWSQQWARMYAEMANDELKHAEYMHQIGQEHINMIGWIPDDCQKAWEDCVSEYGDTMAKVKIMLSK